MVEDITDEEFEAAFVNILEQGSRTNTYKFAFARFLLDYCSKHTEPKVAFKTIAMYFIDYYWFQTIKAKLRQQPHATGWLPITVEIRKRFPEKQYPELFEDVKKRQPQAANECARYVAESAFHDVTWKFQRTVQGRKATFTKIFYDYKVAKSLAPNKKLVNLDYGIVLQPQAMSFLKRYRTRLLPIVMMEWFKFLSPLNPGIPRLIEKIEGRIPRKVPLTLKRKVLDKSFQNCFYCDKPLAKEKKTYMDHVIPYDFVGEDEYWNLVRSCVVCYSTKASHLPPERFVEKLTSRNHDSKISVPEIRKSVNVLGEEREEVERIIHGYYYAARTRGFPVRKHL